MTFVEQKKSAAVITTLVGLSFGMAAPTAKAVLEQNGVPDQSYLDKGATLAGDALSFRVLVPGFGSGRRDTSASFINSRYAITSAHNVADLLVYNPTYEVATGANFNTDRGTVIPVQKVTIYPGYDGTRNTPDIAIIQFATDAAIAPANVIGSTSAGEVVSAAGYGFAFHPSDAVPSAQDGYRRGWDGRVESDPPIDSSATYYQSTFFSGADGVPLVGKLLSGDSGGAVLNSLGQLVGMNAAQSGNANTVGSSIFLNLSQPDVRSWIETNTVVPEPTSLAVLGLAGAGTMLRRRRPA